jgi:ATP-binding cassette subfamily B multidrug efflux pump
MDKLMKGSTSFVIAHRLSTVRNTDEILIMKNGEIIERGNHAALLKLKGKYFELYTVQFD